MLCPSDFGYMAENLRGVFDRSMRRVFRVYLEPAWRRADIFADYSMGHPRAQRSSRKRTSYREVGHQVGTSFELKLLPLIYMTSNKYGSASGPTALNNEDITYQKLVAGKDK